MSPRRIQRRRTKGWKMPPNTIYVGRPSKWGNPFWGLGAADDFRMWASNKRLRGDLHELRGKDLACWCALDRACHADILLKLANA